jgi:hypothetical protein
LFFKLFFYLIGRFSAFYLLFTRFLNFYHNTGDSALGRAFLLVIVGVGDSWESEAILGSKMFPSSRWFLNIFLFYYIYFFLGRFCFVPIFYLDSEKPYCYNVTFLFRSLITIYLKKKHFFIAPQARILFYIEILFLSVFCSCIMAVSF